MHHEAILFIVQLAFILIITGIVGIISHKLKFPDVIAFLLMGVLFGPYLLGAFPMGSFLPEGLFPLNNDNPISELLFTFSIIASVILLFSSGLQSDIELFKKFAVKGSIVGLSAVILSFIGGYLVSVAFFDTSALGNASQSYFHPVHLFLGTITTATSVGISSSVLSSNKMISSPEGTTILSAAVLDDVIGVILLAIVINISDLMALGNTDSISSLAPIILRTSIKAIFIWVFFTALGIFSSRKIGQVLKKFKEPTLISIIALAASFILGYVFEFFDLSVIVGAYVIGLTLSNTDISYVIQERVYPIFLFFVPVFFFVSGMYINVAVIFQLDILIFGLCFALVGLFVKFFGAGVASLFTGFNVLGASRIGAGMLPRGEVSLIIAGIGRASGILDDRIFGATLIMILICSVLAPLILDILLKIPRKGTRKEIIDTSIHTRFHFEKSKLSKLILSEIIQLFQSDGFFINSTRRKGYSVIRIRKNASFITLNYRDGRSIVFDSEADDVPIIKTAVHESVSNIAETASLIKHAISPERLISQQATPPAQRKKNHNDIQLDKYIDEKQVCMHLRSTHKTDILRELVDFLSINEDFTQENRKDFLEDLLEREKILSTGLESGVAIPHARSSAITKTQIVIGLKPEGVDFTALDNKPSSIFILIASPTESPHLEILAKISTLNHEAAFREKLLQTKTSSEVIQLFHS